MHISSGHSARYESRPRNASGRSVGRKTNSADGYYVKNCLLLSRPKKGTFTISGKATDIVILE